MTPNSRSSSGPTSTRDLLTRLQQVLSRQRMILLIAGFCSVLAIGVAAWFLLSLIAAFVVLPVALKLSLLAIAVAAVIAPAVQSFLRAVNHGSVESTALALEAKHPDLKGQLIAAIQFASQPQPEGYSADLVEATHAHAVRRSAELDFASVTSTAPLVTSGRYAGLAVAATIITLLAFPAFFRYAVEVYANPLTKVAPPTPYTLHPLVNGGEVVRFADLEIGAALVGERLPRTAQLRYRLAGGDWQTESINLIDPLSSIRRIDLENRGDSVRIALPLRKINAAVEYQVTAGDLSTEMISIAVVDRPRIESMTLTVYPPAYTKRPVTTFPANEGSGSAILGSRMVINATTNDPMTEATLVINDSIRQPMTITDRKIETTLPLDRSLAYHLELRNRLNETNPDPIRYALTAQPDLFPTIDVLKPGTDINLTDAMAIPLLLHISDDFGFSSLALKFTTNLDGRKGEERVAVLHYPSTITTDGDIDFTWDLSTLKMYPGDQVVYYFEVTDNDRVSGPKTSRSKEYVARFPSLEEITYQAETGGEERISRTEQILREGKQLAERLKQTTRKLDAEQKNSQKPEWQQQQELDATAKAQEDLIKQIDSVAKAMDQQMEQLRDQAVMSREVMEKMEAIQKLFEEVATPEMREAQKKLQEALKEMDKEQIEEAMKEYQESQKEMLERLDRTLALLKRMQLEQKMEAMIRKAEELLREQEALNDQAEKKDAKELAELAPKQDELEKKMEDLKKETSELRDLMKDAKMEDSEEVKKFAEALEKNDAEQNMDKSSKSMSQSKKDEAKSEGKQAEKKLAEMLEKMQKEQMAMQAQSNDQMAKAIREAIDNSNTISEKQEELLSQAAQAIAPSAMLQEIANEQQNLAGATEALKQQVDRIGKASPFISGDLSSLLSAAQEQMKNATEMLGQKNSQLGSARQRDAMSEVNKATAKLMESHDQQKQCNNPDQSSSCPNGMPKLDALSKKQQKLNQDTKGMCENPGNKQGKNGTPQNGNTEAMQRQKEGLKRLAGEQGQIRKQMEELQKELGSSRQLLGRLDDIAKEMAEVEEDLGDGEAGGDTSERQLKILSRMLEATRSLQRRDFNPDRQAATATTNPVFLPPDLARDLGDDQRFDDRLKQFLGDGYPPQYEAQIKAYFRALLEAERSRAAGTAAPHN